MKRLWKCTKMPSTHFLEMIRWHLNCLLPIYELETLRKRNRYCSSSYLSHNILFVQLSQKLYKLKNDPKYIFWTVSSMLHQQDDLPVAMIDLVEKMIVKVLSMNEFHLSLTKSINLLHERFSTKETSQCNLAQKN